MHKYRHYLIDNTIFNRQKTILLAKSVQKRLNSIDETMVSSQVISFCSWISFSFHRP